MIEDHPILDVGQHTGVKVYLVNGMRFLNFPDGFKPGPYVRNTVYLCSGCYRGLMTKNGGCHGDAPKLDELEEPCPVCGGEWFRTEEIFANPVLLAEYAEKWGVMPVDGR